MPIHYISDYRVFDTPAEKTVHHARQFGYAARLHSLYQRDLAQRKLPLSTLSLQDFRAMLETAIWQKRVKFYFNDDGQVAGYVVWAWLVEEVEQRVLQHGKFTLHESEWNEGDRLWLVDVLAPFGNFKYILRDLRDQLFGQQQRVFYLRKKGGMALQKCLQRSPGHGFFPGEGTDGALSQRWPAITVLHAMPTLLSRLSAPLRDVEFDDGDDADLAAFGAAIGEARMVVLGSQTQGEGNLMALRARMVRYLHEKKGYRILALEGGSFDTECVGEAVDGGASYSSAGLGALFYMYAQARELQPFFRYLDEQRRLPQGLRLLGFHTKHSGRFAQVGLCARLQQQFGQLAPALFAGAEWELFYQITSEVIQMSEARPADDVLARYFSHLAALVQLLARQPDRPGPLLDSPVYWCRTLSELEQAGKRHWGLGDSWQARERSLADYLLWLAKERHPGEKIVVWSQNLHAQRHPQAQMMGSLLGHSLGGALVTVGFTGSQGAYVEWTHGGVKPVPPDTAESLEAQLCRRDREHSMLDLRQPQAANALRHISGWSAQHYRFGDTPLPGSFDLMVHARTVTPTCRFSLGQIAAPLAIHSFAPGDDSDLVAFGEAVDQAQIVVLGQQTSADDDLLTLKTRLVRYLHQKKGFQVLALESSPFDVECLRRAVAGGATHHAAASGALPGGWERHTRMAPLLDYLDQAAVSTSPLQLAGFDSGHSGGHAQRQLLDQLRQEWQPAAPGLFADADWKLFCQLSGEAMGGRKVARAAPLLARYRQRLQQLRLAMAAPSAAHPDKTAYWSALLAGLEWQVLRDQGGDAQALLVQQHRAMADELLWLAQQRYPLQKIIVWAGSNQSALRYPQAPLMGTLLGQALGPKLVTVGFTGVPQQGAPLATSLEAVLNAEAGPGKLLDLRKYGVISMLPQIQCWNYQDFQPTHAPLRGAFDLIVHLRGVG